MQRQSKQTGFAVVGVERHNFGGQVQQRLGDFSVFQNFDQALVFHDEHARITLGLNHGQWLVQATHHFDQLYGCFSPGTGRHTEKSDKQLERFK